MYDLRVPDDDVEEQLAALLRARALAPAAIRALEAYGKEIFRYLVSLVGNEADAQEVFSQVAEDLWRGLPKFAARCSMRTWLYVLARHANARFRRTPWNQRERRTGDDDLDAVVEHARTQTQPWLRTDVKDRWRAVRESLDADDRSLLVLRIDGKMEWKDIARVTLGNDSPDPAELTREADRLKKRLSLLKRELRKRAREAGVLDDGSEGS
jgi:RNA polymerase sigma-70 factor (ECF subfamily)